MGLASTFTNSIVREIGRNYGKSISNNLLGDSHSTPVRMVRGGQTDITRKRGRIYENKLDEYLQKIKGGWTDVDVIITMPSVMGKLGPLGRVLGPRGLMPNPKTGTVTMDVAKAVKEVKAGKIDFKVDKTGIIHAAVAKSSFDADKIAENANELLQTIIKLKPTASKGAYIKSVFMSSTMSPSVEVDVKSVS